jgi:hypothetical protein
MAKMSRENQKEHVAFGGLERDLVKVNDHQNIYNVVFDLAIPRFLPRQWVNKLIWKWDEGKQELMVAGEGVQHDGFPERKEYLRASGSALYKYTREAEVGEIPQTKVTWIQQVDLGGAIPKWVQNRQGVEQLMYVRALAKQRSERKWIAHSGSPASHEELARKSSCRHRLKSSAATSGVRPSTCAIEHVCDLAGRKEASGGPPRQPLRGSASAVEGQPSLRSLAATSLARFRRRGAILFCTRVRPRERIEREKVLAPAAH